MFRMRSHADSTGEINMKTTITAYATAAFLMILLCALPAQAEYLGKINKYGLTQTIVDSESELVLVDFWATWCGPCRKTIPHLIELRKQYPQAKLEIIGLSVDQREDLIPTFMDQVGINYKVYMGSPDVSAAFRVSAVPKMMIFQGRKILLDHAGYIPPQSLQKVLDNLFAEYGSSPTRKPDKGKNQ